MTVSKKPTQAKRIEEVINKGGSVSHTSPTQKKARRIVLIRINEDTHSRILDIIDNKSVRISRNQWIEEAIIEKLNKSKSEEVP